MRRALVVFGAFALTGCTVANQQTAMTAQERMVGMSKPAVLACMGAPLAKAVEGPIEAWTYG